MPRWQGTHLLAALSGRGVQHRRRALILGVVDVVDTQALQQLAHLLHRHAIPAAQARQEAPQCVIPTLLCAATARSVMLAGDEKLPVLTSPQTDGHMLT